MSINLPRAPFLFHHQISHRRCTAGGLRTLQLTDQSQPAHVLDGLWCQNLAFGLEKGFATDVKSNWGPRSTLLRAMFRKARVGGDNCLMRSPEVLMCVCRLLLSVAFQEFTVGSVPSLHVTSNQYGIQAVECIYGCHFILQKLQYQYTVLASILAQSGYRLTSIAWRYMNPHAYVSCTCKISMFDSESLHDLHGSSLSS